MRTYDAIVLGVGGVGSAALWRLAARGLRVLGIDQFAPPHAEGSSHGQTRIIRQAYFEHPDYVPLAIRASAMWTDLESLTGQTLFERTGLLEFGPPDGVVIPGILKAAAEHGLELETPTLREVAERWPQFHVPEGLQPIFEPTGGFLHTERCVAACLDVAERQGAETMVNTQVLGWHAEGNALAVRTTAGVLRTDRLVLTAGPWAAHWLAGLGVELVLRRKSLFWFTAPGDHTPRLLPPFLFELPNGVFYGVPSVTAPGVKAGDHSVGQRLSSPEAIDRTIVLEEELATRGFLSQCMPHVSTQLTAHSTCFYTMTPDEHFLVDRHPADGRVAFAAGLSGHGFKFAPVLGEALAELATNGRTMLPIGFLGLQRFAQAS